MAQKIPKPQVVGDRLRVTTKIKYPAGLNPDGPYPLLEISATAGTRGHNPALDWLTLERPEMERWRNLAHRWLSRVAHDRNEEAAARGRNLAKLKNGRVIANKMVSLHSFLVDYLRDERYPERAVFLRDPDALLRAGSAAPDDFWEQCCLPLTLKEGGEKRSKGTAASARSKDIYNFLTWVIDTEHGKSADHLSYRCPFEPRTGSGILFCRKSKSP